MSQAESDDIAPVTPGEILAEEFLSGYGLSQAALARALKISPNCIAEIVNNRRGITADTALRLGLFFGTTPEFWQNLQAHYDMKMARRNLSPEMAEQIAAQRVACAGRLMNEESDTSREHPSRIPEFRSREEEADFWDTHDVTDYLDELRPVRVRFDPHLREPRMPRIFDHEDEEYLRWVDGHPQGFVVNAYRNLNPGYLMLHRASCGTINGTPARGNTWTSGDFVKICSQSRQDLEEWAARTVRGVLSACRLCRPE